MIVPEIKGVTMINGNEITEYIKRLIPLAMEASNILSVKRYCLLKPPFVTQNINNEVDKRKVERMIMICSIVNY